MLRTLTVGLLASLLPGQRPFDLIQSDEAVVVQMDGPEALRMVFLPTSVGSLLAAREARDFWSLLGGPVMERAGKLSKVDFGPVSEMLLDYRGRMTLAVDVLEEKATAIDGVLVLAPDGETDLRALSERLATWLDGMRKTRVSVELGGRELTTHATVGGVAITRPILIDDHLVMVFGRGLKGAVVKRRQSTKPWAPDPDFAESPIAIQLNLEKLLSRKGARWVGSEDLAKLLGFHSLDELRMLARPRGPRVEIELSVAFNSDERGIFAGMLPALTDPPALASLVPPGHPDWAAGKFDVGLLAAAVLKAVRVWAPALVRDGEWTELCEALAAMSPDYVQVGSFSGEGREFGEACLAFQLRDPVAFDEIFWPMVGEEASTHAAAIAAGEVVTHREKLFFDMGFVRWRQLVFLHHGEQGEAWFKQMLERARQDEKGVPKEIERLRRDAGPGFQGCARIDLRHLARALPRELVLWIDPAGEYDQFTKGLMRELLPLLTKYEVDKVHAITAWEERRWRTRLYW